MTGSKKRRAMLTWQLGEFFKNVPLQCGSTVNMQRWNKATRSEAGRLRYFYSVYASCRKNVYKFSDWHLTQGSREYTLFVCKRYFPAVPSPAQRPTRTSCCVWWLARRQRLIASNAGTTWVRLLIREAWGMFRGATCNCACVIRRTSCRHRLIHISWAPHGGPTGQPTCGHLPFTVSG